MWQCVSTSAFCARHLSKCTQQVSVGFEAIKSAQRRLSERVPVCPFAEVLEIDRSGGARWREKCKWEQEKKQRHQGSEAVLFFSLTPPQSSTLNLFINIQHHIKHAIQISTGIHAKVKNWQCLFQTPAPKVSLLLWPEVFMFIKLKEKIIATARCSLAELI